MNGLSWLLYFGDVVGNVGVATTLGCVCGTFVLLGTTIAAVITTVDADYGDVAPLWRRYAGRAAVFLVICAVVAVVTPRRDTVILIAASEVGETVLASKDVQAIGGEAGALASDSLKLLRKYVTDQLGEEGKPAK